MKKLILLISFLFISLQVTGQAYKTESGTAKFHSEVPLHSFTGVSEHLVGLVNLENNVVDFYLDLETLKTGIGKRDRDMRQTLETEKYPFASFYGKLVSDFDPSTNSVQQATVIGDFKIHNIEREIEVKGTLQMTDKGLKLTAGWTLLLENYKIKPPEILFVKVDQEQDIEIEALLTPVDN